MRWLFCIFFCFSNAAFAADIHVTKGASRSISIQTDNGRDVHVDEQYIRVEMSFPSGKKLAADVRMVFDPKTHLFWWQYQNINIEKPSISVGYPFVLYLTKNKIVGFHITKSALTILESSERYKSIAEGESKFIEVLKINAKKIEQEPGIYIGNWHRLEIGRILQETFSLGFFDVPDKMFLLDPKLLNIKRSKKTNGWHLILEGVNKAKGELIISEDYKVLGIALLSDKKQIRKK